MSDYKNLFNKNKSIRFHNEFYFKIVEGDTKEMIREKKPLLGRRFRCVGAKSLDTSNKFWTFRVENTEDHFKCLDTNEKFYYKRDKFFKMKPIIDLDKNPDWAK